MGAAISLGSPATGACFAKQLILAELLIQPSLGVNIAVMKDQSSIALSFG